MCFRVCFREDFPSCTAILNAFIPPYRRNSNGVCTVHSTTTGEARNMFVCVVRVSEGSWGVGREATGTLSARKKGLECGGVYMYIRV